MANLIKLGILEKPNSIFFIPLESLFVTSSSFNDFNLVIAFDNKPTVRELYLFK